MLESSGCYNLAHWYPSYCHQYLPIPNTQLLSLVPTKTYANTNIYASLYPKKLSTSVSMATSKHSPVPPTQRHLLSHSVSSPMKVTHPYPPIKCTSASTHSLQLWGTTPIPKTWGQWRQLFFPWDTAHLSMSLKYPRESREPGMVPWFLITWVLEPQSGPGSLGFLCIRSRFLCVSSYV